MLFDLGKQTQRKNIYCLSRRLLIIKEQDSLSFFQTILWCSSDSQNFEEYHCLNFTTIFCSSEYLICSKNLEFIYIFDQLGGSC